MFPPQFIAPWFFLWHCTVHNQTVHDGVRPPTSRSTAAACSRVSSNISPAPNRNTGPLSCSYSVVANIKWCNIRLGCAMGRRSTLSQTWPVYLKEAPPDEALIRLCTSLRNFPKGVFEEPKVRFLCPWAPALPMLRSDDYQFSIPNSQEPPKQLTKLLSPGCPINASSTL